jgi:ketosteroid isomerase-like protein
MMTLATISLATVLLSGGGVQGPPVQLPSVELPAPLQRVLTDYETAWQKRDSAGLSLLFAEDGFVLQNGGQPVRGREAIKKLYAGAGGDLALRAFAYGAERSVAYILGGFTSKKGQPDAGKFTLTLRKDKDGRWLIVSDMDNMNTARRG